MKPIIGIIARPNFPKENNSNLVVKEVYRKKIIEAGGIPFLLLPPKLINYNNAKPSENKDLSSEEKEILLSQLKMCDGILMPGGYKVFSHDFFILDYAIKNDIPVLGICLGMQIMANYEQNYLTEQIDSRFANHFDISGNYVHNINISKDSKLFSIVNKDKITVNSMHKYKVVSNGLYNVVAVSDDNIIEALEFPDNTFNIGVQWHPERLDDDASKKLFKAYIESCKR